MPEEIIQSAHRDRTYSVQVEEGFIVWLRGRLTFRKGIEHLLLFFHSNFLVHDSARCNHMKEKKKERKRREGAIYLTITASSDIRYCRHNIATPIDLDRVPVSFRDVIHTHTHTRMLYATYTQALCACVTG